MKPETDGAGPVKIAVWEIRDAIQVARTVITEISNMLSPILLGQSPEDSKNEARGVPETEMDELMEDTYVAAKELLNALSVLKDRIKL